MCLPIAPLRPPAISSPRMGRGTTSARLQRTRTATNSWFVPLLHAASGTLSSQAAETRWHEACHTLRSFAAVPAALLLDAFRDAAARHHTPPPKPARVLPWGAELHVSRVVRQIAATDG